jgi:hypothetical protein
MPAYSILNSSPCISPKQADRLATLLAFTQGKKSVTWYVRKVHVILTFAPHLSCLHLQGSDLQKTAEDFVSCDLELQWKGMDTTLFAARVGVMTCSLLVKHAYSRGEGEFDRH